MDFAWTPEQREYHDSVASFAQRRLSSRSQAEREPGFSRELWRACAEVGIQGLPVPEDLGGSGAAATTIAFALEALGYGTDDGGLVFSLGAHMWACEVPLLRFGSPAQKQRFLPGMCDGSIIGAQAMTEADSGSDAFSLATTARAQPGGYLLNGSKTFVTNAPEADVLLVYASTDRSLGFAGLSAFLLERDSQGLSVGTPFQKLGLSSSPMSEVHLDDCFVAEEMLLGRPGSGMAIFNLAMLWERGLILAAGLGTMRRQLERSVAHARQRSQFGRPIGEFQAVSHRIAEMKLRLETARLLVYRLAWLLERGEAKAHDAALVKLHVSESLLQSALDAVQIHGGYGYLSEYQIEAELRDAIGSRIHSGTSEMQRNLIARGLGL